EKRRGINWEGLNREEYPTLVTFLDKATAQSPAARFTNVAEAQEVLSGRAISRPSPERAIATGESTGLPVGQSAGAAHARQLELHEQRIPWLLSLLQSYPGSRWGNRETRGLDTDFASQTYVETTLEETLLKDINDRRVRLVILCGNA